MSLKEEVEKCRKIHDILAEHWSWAYYNTSHSECSWLLGEYVKRLKRDVECRMPIMLEEIEEILQQHRQDTFSILDVGCGVGGFIYRAISSLTQMYPDIRFRASGIDISSEMIEYASNYLSDLEVELICDSITSRPLKFKNEPFDVAILMATLSFYRDENAKEILDAIHDKLRTGGWLAIMDFASTYRWKGFTLFQKPLQKLTDMFFSHLVGESVHFINRTKDQLETLLSDAGFKVTKSCLSDKKSKMKGMLVIRAAALSPQQRRGEPKPLRVTISKHADKKGTLKQG